MTESEWVLGVDGGGSTTRVWLARRDPSDSRAVLGRGVADSSNPRIHGPAAAIENLNRAVDASFADAGVPRQSVSIACLGVAGADRQSEQSLIGEWARRTDLAQQVLITNDAIPILFASRPDGVGIALISGTGAFAIGRDGQGQTARSNGWGPIMGDEGSGYAIAKSGLAAAARSADGRGRATALLNRFLEHFRIEQAADLIRAIHADDFGRADIARLASIVFEVAASGDRVADQIVSDAATELALAVSAVQKRLAIPGKRLVLSLAGGVLLNQSTLRDRLRLSLQELRVAPVETVLVPEPVAGAVALARRGSL